MRFALLCLAWLVARALPAQSLMVAPHAVVVTDKAHTGALTLVNTSDKAVEVSLSTAYGYPVSDSAGRMTLLMIDSVRDTMPSAAAWVRFFPDRLVVPPSARRTVRLLVTPPSGVPNGEYWSRIVVAARGGSVAVDGAGSPGIGIGLALEVRSVLGLFYRQGQVTTGVRVDSVRLSREADSVVVVRARLKREGNAAFVGSFRAIARDTLGIVRAQVALPLGVYYTLDPRVALPASALPTGTYTFTIEAMTDRPDVPDAALVKAATRRVSVAVAVP